MNQNLEAIIRGFVASDDQTQFGKSSVVLLLDEINRLRAIVDSLAERVAAQSALLSKRAEREPVAVDDSGDIGDWWELGGEG